MRFATVVEVAAAIVVVVVVVVVVVDVVVVGAAVVVVAGAAVVVVVAAAVVVVVAVLYAMESVELAVLSLLAASVNVFAATEIEAVPLAPAVGVKVAV